MPLPCAQALRLLRQDAGFRSHVTALLANSECAAFRWETPPITTASLDHPFEFVLVNDPLLDMDPEPEVFQGYFTGCHIDAQVLPIHNLGKTAVMVVPRQIAPAPTYAHFARFVRGAPEAQVHALWTCVAETVLARLSDRRLWVSTAGGGVAWLHVRVENEPKYYAYRPYADSGE
jgi:hypothetical protein